MSGAALTAALNAAFTAACARHPRPKTSTQNGRASRRASIRNIQDHRKTKLIFPLSSRPICPTEARPTNQRRQRKQQPEAAAAAAAVEAGKSSSKTISEKKLASLIEAPKEILSFLSIFLSLSSILILDRSGIFVIHSYFLFSINSITKLQEKISLHIVDV